MNTTNTADDAYLPRHCNDPCGYFRDDFGIADDVTPRDRIRALNFTVALKAISLHIMWLISPECDLPESERTTKIAGALAWAGTFHQCLTIILKPGTLTADEEHFVFKWHDVSGLSSPSRFYDEAKHMDDDDI